MTRCACKMPVALSGAGIGRSPNNLATKLSTGKHLEIHVDDKSMWTRQSHLQLFWGKSNLSSISIKQTYLQEKTVQKIDLVYSTRLRKSSQIESPWSEVRSLGLDPNAHQVTKILQLLLLMIKILHQSSAGRGPSSNWSKSCSGRADWSAIKITFVGLGRIPVYSLYTIRFNSSHFHQSKICQDTWRPWSALQRSSSPNDPPLRRRATLPDQWRGHKCPCWPILDQSFGMFDDFCSTIVNCWSWGSTSF